MIKTIGDLKKLIANIDDEFKIELNIVTELSKEELDKMSYPYHYAQEPAYLEYRDIGHSDKVVSFEVYKLNEK